MRLSRKYTMQQAFDDVKRLVDSMSFILTKAGIRHAMPTGAIDRIPLKSYSEIYDFLHRLYMSAAWREAQRAKELVSDDSWARLEIIGNKHMVEYKHLRKFLPDVVALWKPPFKFFGKHHAEVKIEDQFGPGEENPVSSSVRPEQTGATRRNSRRGRHSVLFDQSKRDVGGEQTGRSDPAPDLREDQA